MKPTVVINTFDRPAALSRLLRSLEAAAAPAGTDVVISIDGGAADPAATLAVAHSLRWTAGAVDVRQHADLGLVGHFRCCGALTAELGPIVLLEDDLVVGPNALLFAAAALSHTAEDERIAGVSLSSPWFEGFRHLPFEPLLDGSDAVFAKLPWFHGMAWTPQQWARHLGGALASPEIALPASYERLDDDEWLPDAIRSLVARDHWFLLAREAHVLNFGDAGVHFSTPTSIFQQRLAQGRFRPPHLLTLDDPDVVPYDEFLEPDPRWLARRVPDLDGRDVTIDLRGIRSPGLITTDWTVTTRATSRATVTWGSVMRPLEQNLVSSIAGAEIALTRTEDIIESRRSRQRAEYVNVMNAHRSQPPGIEAAIRRRVQRALFRSKP